MKEQGLDATDGNMRIIAQEIAKSKYSPDTAVVIIVAEKLKGWIGKLSDSNGVETPHVGLGADYSFIRCENDGIYSVSIQKIEYPGYFLIPTKMTIQVWQEGEKLQEGSTGFVNGLVSLTGNCH